MDDVKDNADADPLAEWRQGDFARGVGGFLFAGLSESDEPYDPEESADKVSGLVVISQTCDVVRRTAGREYVAVCALTKVDPADIGNIKKGRKPYYARVDNAEEDEFADFRRVMSVHKDLVASWNRTPGFESKDSAKRFAAHIERKFGAFAFPDEFNEAIRPLANRIWKRHDKDSEVGRIYRSLRQIRFQAIPNWDAEQKRIRLVAILHPTDRMEASREKIGSELDEQLNNIIFPDGYSWAEPNFELAAASEHSAESIFDSEPADFDFLSA